jgi:hypothetical protein
MVILHPFFLAMAHDLNSGNELPASSRTSSTIRAMTLPT